MTATTVPARPGGISAPPETDRYPWVAMSVVLIGTFMVLLDTTIVNIALPQIGAALGRTANIEWVVTAYMLAAAVGLPATGWLADRFGRKRLFVTSLGLFTLGSLCAALSPTLEVLVVFRALQGLGGGFLMPVSMTMVYELFPPHKRATALGLWGVASMAAPAFGPVVGGYLVTSASWHWLFLVNVPIGVAGVVAGSRLLRDTGYRNRQRFDGTGLALASAALVALLVGFSRAGSSGWGASGTVTLLVAGAALFIAFVRRELRIEHPLIDVRMFKVPVFTLSMLLIWVGVLVQFARLVFLPLELQTLRGWTALEVGVLFIPPALATAVAFPLAGRITDRLGPRIPVIAGGALMAGAAWQLGHLTPHTPKSTILVALVVQGFGTGFAMMPLSVTGMNALPSRLIAQASAVGSVNRRLAGALGVAILATIVSMRLGSVSAAGVAAHEVGTAQAAYNSVFLVTCAGGILVFALGWLLPDRATTRAHQEARAAENPAFSAGVA